MKILLIGKTGQLGWELHRAVAPLGEVVAVDYPEIDLANADSIANLVRQTAPNLILNPAAYTAVDRAESEPALAMAINGVAPGLLAELAREMNAGLVHYSTDYVFDGTKGTSYVETDLPNPLNVYGRTKLAGDLAVEQVAGAYWIFRTSWVYSLRRDSFLKKVWGWARQHPTLRIVTDQVGSPTWARMLAQVTALALAGKNPLGTIEQTKGVYHVAGAGAASRFEWAQAILARDPHPEEQILKELLPALSVDFPTPAQRPLYSALDCSRFEQVFGLRLPEWRETLEWVLE